MFDDKKPTGLMVGRFQPFHQGHVALFEAILEKEGQVLIAVRDTFGVDTQNPFSEEFVCQQIEEKLAHYKDKFKIVVLPNIAGIYYGRDVGYKVEHIDLPEHIKKISATQIRNDMQTQKTNDD